MQQRQQKHQQKAIFYFRAHENECASAIMEQRGADRYYHCLFAGVSSDDRIPSFAASFLLSLFQVLQVPKQQEEEEEGIGRQFYIVARDLVSVCSPT